MIRLAVRCRPDQAELVLAELTVLAPNGVEEERGPGYVEYAIYGGPGELPELGEIEVAAGDGLVEVVATEVPDDWADRWRDFHRAVTIGERLTVRPSWEPAERQGGLEVVVDPGRAFGTGAHPTTRLCIEFLLELADAGEAAGPLTDLGCGSGVLAIAAAKLGWAPVAGYDHEQAAIEAAIANAEINEVDATFTEADLRDGLPSLAPTTVANLTAPTLAVVAERLSGRQGRARRSLPAVAPTSPPLVPATMVLSGLLPPELDATAALFAPTGLREAARRADGDWAALLLRRG